MITREQYILQKQDIEERMKQSRLRQQNEIAAINEVFELRLRDCSDEYRRRRQAIFDERAAQRLEIDSKYKDVRRALWAEDVQLVEEWRSGLRVDEGQLSQKGGAAL